MPNAAPPSLVPTEEMEEEDHDRLPKDGQAGVAATVLNLTNNIVGAGLLSLPWCLHEASLVSGLALLSFVAVLSCSSFMVVAIACKATDRFTYKALGEATFGVKFGSFMQATMMLYTALSCLSYLILCCDFIAGENGVANNCYVDEGPANGGDGPTVGGARATRCNWFWMLFVDRKFVVLFTTVVVLVPLALQKNLSALKYTSFISFLGMMYTMGLMVWYFSEHDPSPNVTYFKLDTGLFAAAPVMNVAFTAQYNAPRYFEELENRSLRRFAAAVSIALFLCLCVYGLTALFGYLSFGDAIHNDVLESFHFSSKPAILARIAMTCVVLFTYPLAFFSLRQSFVAFFFNGTYPARTLLPERLGGSFVLITICLMIVTVTPALFLTNISVVLDYKGALFGGLISYGFPGMIFLFLARKSVVAPATQIQVEEDGTTGLQDQNDSPRSAGVEVDEMPLLRSDALTNEQVDSSAPSLAFLSAPQQKYLVWASYVFIGFTVVMGIMGVTVTTVKVIQGT